MNKKPCNLVPKSPEPYQEHSMTAYFLHSGLTLNCAFSLGHGFSSIKVLPTPDKRAQQRNKGMAENHTKSLVSNISIEGKRWEELCMTGNEMATSDCLGGGFLVCVFCYSVSWGTVVSPSFGAASPKPLWSQQQYLAGRKDGKFPLLCRVSAILKNTRIKTKETWLTSDAF